MSPQIKTLNKAFRAWSLVSKADDPEAELRKRNPRAAEYIDFFRNISKDCAIYLSEYVRNDKVDSKNLQKVKSTCQKIHSALNNLENLDVSSWNIVYSPPESGKSRAVIQWMQEKRKNKNQRGILVTGKSNEKVDYYLSMSAWFGVADAPSYRWIQAMLVAMYPIVSDNLSIPILLWDDFVPKPSNLELLRKASKKSLPFHRVIITSSEEFAMELTTLPGVRLLPGME